MTPNEISNATKSAIGWSVIAEVLRRHPEGKLRAFVHHPGGGQYFCLGIRLEAPFRAVAFNLAGGAVEHHREGRPFNDVRDDARLWDGIASYQAAVLNGKLGAVVNSVETMLELLPKTQGPLPEMTPGTLCFSATASLMRERALDANGEFLVAEPGWYEGSDGASLRPFVEAFPAVFARANQLLAADKDPRRAANRVWRVRFGDRAVIMHVSTGAALVEGKAEDHVPLWKVYEADGFGDVTAWLAKRLWPEVR